MMRLFLLTLCVLVTSAAKVDLVKDQIINFKNNVQGPIGIMTVGNGAPIESKDAGSTLNTNLLENEFFLDTLTHFARERCPVRAVHPKGAGAFGYFITTRDMSNVTKAEFLNGVGKVTPVAARLSMGATERGGSDLTREPRGFAVKFYTKEGNFDIPGFNTPIFTYKDPTLFTPFGHVMRTNPVTDLPDLNMVWDFITLHPESLYIFLYVFSDEGVPDGYRHMRGHSIHTHPLYNDAGKMSFARFHFEPVSGVKVLNSTYAAQTGAMDPNYCARDLYNAIASGDYPTWDLYLQIMSEEDVKNATYAFDVTQEIPEKLFPSIKVGKLVLNRNPKNYFAEVEKMAFCPSNLVPGILGSPDKTYQARRFSYRDAARYRLGVNFDKIPVNLPYRSKVLSYNRDGVAPTADNGLGMPNYYPNSFNGPIPYVDKNRPKYPVIHELEANNLEQCKNFYEDRILGDHRLRLAENIATNLCGAADFLQDRAVKLFSKVHVDLGKNIAKVLKANNCRHKFIKY